MPEPTREPEAWLEDLLYGSSADQEAAAAALEKLGTPVVTPVCTALDQVQATTRELQHRLSDLEATKTGDPDERYREARRLRSEIAQNEEHVLLLARVLQTTRDREALQTLAEALRRSHSREAHALAQAIAPHGPPAIPLLEEALESRLLWVAMSAAEALATIGGPEVARLLVQRLETASHDLLRVCLIRCLGRIGDPVAVDTLSLIVATGHRDEKLYAVEALGRIGQGLNPVLRCAADGPNSSDVALYAAALRALGGIADPRGIPLLVAALQDPRSQLHEPAVEALALIAEQAPVIELRQALPALRRRVRRPHVERESVVRAYTALADRIESVTNVLKSLPLPSAGRCGDSQELPLPVHGTARSAKGLPIPDTSIEGPDSK